jgi:hypothetical protein
VRRSHRAAGSFAPEAHGLAVARSHQQPPAGVVALRDEFTAGTSPIHAPLGGLGGHPPSPSHMRWLWPEADADEDKPITLADPPPAGEVNFFAKMNGTGSWTDLIPAGTWLRALHLNKLRWSCETLRRGRRGQVADAPKLWRRSGHRQEARGGLHREGPRGGPLRGAVDWDVRRFLIRPGILTKR